MKPRERFLTALRREQPDEVPVSLSIGPTNAKRWIGRPDWRAVYQAHRLVGSIPTYGYDGRCTRRCQDGGCQGDGADGESLRKVLTMSGERRASA